MVTDSYSVGTDSTAPSVRLQPVTDAEKHSASTAALHQQATWSGDEVKRSDLGSEGGVRIEVGSKWSRRNPSDVSDESDKGLSGRKTPSSSSSSSWRRGMSTQVGVTSPRTKGSSSSGSSAGVKVHSSGESLAVAGGFIILKVVYPLGCVVLRAFVSHASLKYDATSWQLTRVKTPLNQCLFYIQYMGTILKVVKPSIHLLPLI